MKVKDFIKQFKKSDMNKDLMFSTDICEDLISAKGNKHYIGDDNDNEKSSTMIVFQFSDYDKINKAHEDSNYTDAKR
jgi:hypothetical protein